MHVRETLEGNVTLDELRRMWLPISPLPFLERVRGREILLVYALYDLTFPVDLSRMLVDAFRRHGVAHELLGAAVRPLQHGRDAVQVDGWADALPVPEPGAVGAAEPPYRYLMMPWRAS